MIELIATVESSNKQKICEAGVVTVFERVIRTSPSNIVYTWGTKRINELAHQYGRKQRCCKHFSIWRNCACAYLTFSKEIGVDNILLGDQVLVQIMKNLVLPILRYVLGKRGVGAGVAFPREEIS